MRWTVYVDMDAYYVSCELRDRPDLVGRPVIVGPDPKLGPTRGVVLSASYEARAFGVRSALPVGQADRLCPTAVWIPADFSKYGAISAEIRELLSARSPRMIPLSIDEAALEVESPDGDTAGAFARAIQEELGAKLHLPASLGVSPYRTVAKIASDRAKPAGVLVVRPEETATFLGPLPIASVPGVGPKTAERLHGVGVERIADVRTVPAAALRAAVGEFAGELTALANGTPMESEWSSSGPRSRSSAETFVSDVADLSALLVALDRLADSLADGLDHEHLTYQTVTVAVRWDDFRRVQRSQSIGVGHRGPGPLRSSGHRLLGEIWRSELPATSRKVRTLSLSAERLRSIRPAARVLEEFGRNGHD